jgi:hypothetical protein
VESNLALVRSGVETFGVVDEVVELGAKSTAKVSDRVYMRLAPLRTSALIKALRERRIAIMSMTLFILISKSFVLQ